MYDQTEVVILYGDLYCICLVTDHGIVLLWGFGEESLYCKVNFVMYDRSEVVILYGDLYCICLVPDHGIVC